jgi:hypothetical protein
MNLAALHGQLGETERQLALLESLLDDERLSRSRRTCEMIVNLYLGEETAAQGSDAPRARARERASRAQRISASNCCPRPGYLSAEVDRNAIDPLAERAAQLSESGDLYLRVARLHMDAYALRGGGRRTPPRAALKKGALLKDEGHAWLLRGMAEVRLEALPRRTPTL